MVHNRKNLKTKWQLFLTIILILYMVGWNYSGVAAVGITYYVDNTNVSCSDLGTGLTTILPFCTISSGVAAATFGDTVRVLAGTYAETVTMASSGIAGNPITFSAAPGVTVTGAAPKNNGFRMSTKSYIVVDGFTITGTVDYGIYVWGSNNITLSNNQVSDSGSPVSGSTRPGIYINSTTNSTISGNTSDHNSSHGIHLTNDSNNNLVSNNLTFGNAQEWQRDASGIRLDGSSNNTFLHNISYGNADSGITNSTGSSGNLIIGNLLYGNGDHGIDNLNSPNNTVIGNTVQGNVTSGINFEGASVLGSGGATVANNIMVDNGLRQQVGGGTTSGQSGNLRFDANSLTGNTLDYNIYYLNSGTAQIRWGATTYATLAAFQGAVAGQENNGLQADPLFIAPAPVAQRPAAAPWNVAVNVGDYHLTSISPAIDSANSAAPNEPILDLGGNARVDDPFTIDSGAGTRTYDDRGVYEFQPTIGVALPAVTTEAVSSIGPTSATGNGTITDLGVPNPTAYGVVWSTALNPTTADNVSDLGAAGAIGAFTAPITGLTPGTLYHVRAFATNIVGTSYGADFTLTTTAVAPTVTTDPASSISAMGVTLNGTVNANNASTTFSFEYGLTAAYGSTVTAVESPVTGSTDTAVTYVLSGLLPNTTYHFRVVGVNTGGTSNGGDLTFATAAVAPIITSGALSTGTVGVAYSHTFTATGVPAPTLNLTGVLPAGLSFDGVDTISGTPTSGGTFAGLSVTATNGVSLDDTQNFSIAINAPTITLAPGSLPSGTLTVAYNQTITASGGTSPYTFAVTAGALPTNLTLSSTGVLSGIPTVNGTFNFTITATDSSTGTGPFMGGQAYSIIVNDNTMVSIDQAAGQVDPTNSTSINFTVAFSEAVTGFATGDVDFTGSTVGGTLTGTVTEIAPNDSTTYNLAVTGMTSSGTVVATIPAGVAIGSVTTNAASTSTDNTVTYDSVNPTVASTDLTTNYTGTGPGSFIATFSKAVDNPAGDTGTDDVTNPANYLLVNKGTNGVVDTGSCVGGVVADDTPVTVTSVVYNSTTFQATVTLVGALSFGSYRLFICGTTSIVDLAGNHLNGGTDYTFDFIVQTATQSGGGNHLLPATGFPQDKITTLPFQPADKAYTSTDLWLEIPKLGVKMSIVGVPQSKDGWDISWLGKNAGWLNGSAFPTWKGNSVITGHVWDVLNRPGPFSGLINLTYGDQITVHAFGQIYVYEVTESQMVQPSSITAAFKHEKKSWLTLITCENYQDKTETYTNRRMVRAILVNVVGEK